MFMQNVATVNTQAKQERAREDPGARRLHELV